MIGIFDSGVGGLTVLSALRRAYPSVDVVYFGDTARAPYGQRSREELSTLTASGLRFLVDHGATALVSACNSVSASLVLSLYDMLELGSMPVIEMVGPTVSALRHSSKRLALCATVATVEGRLYQNAFSLVGKEVSAVAIPELAGAIERGEGNEAYEAHIRAALEALPSDSYDALILACTHYPLVRDVFERVVPGKILIDPAEAVAERVYRTLWPREMGYGRTRFYLSAPSTQFDVCAAALFPGSEYSIEVA